MPRPSESSLRYIRPFSRSASLSASSTVNACTPVLLAISSVCRPAGRAGPIATNRAKRVKAVDRRRRMGPRLRGMMLRINWKDGPRLVRGEAQRAAVRAYLSRHQALRPWPETDQHGLARAQLGEAVTAQRFHVHENVGRAVAAGEKSEAAQPVEPLDLGTLQPAGRRHRDMGTRRRHLRRMYRGRLVHRQNAEGLQALGALLHLAHYPRALVGGLEAIAA